MRSQMSTTLSYRPVLGMKFGLPLTLQLSRGVVTVLVQIRLVQGVRRVPPDRGYAGLQGDRGCCLM